MIDEPTPCGGGTHREPRSQPRSEVDRSALFARCWPVAASRVLRMLLATGSDRHTAEELVQETAFRVWRSGAPFESPADLAAYARRVALNLRVALFRRSARLAHGELPVVAADDDVEAAAEARIALDRTLTELATMADTDRRAILYGVWGDPEDWRGYNPWKMRRSRARERLRALVEGAAALVAGVRQRLRWLEVEGAPTAAAAAVVAACLLPVVGAFVPTGPAPSSPPAHADRSPSLVVDRVPPSPIAPPDVRAPRALGDRRAARDDALPTRVEPSAADPRPDPILATPKETEGLTGTGTVTPHDGDELLRVCTKDDPLLGTGCPVSLTRPDGLPGPGR